MLIIVKLIGLAIFVLGFLMLLKPELINKIFEYFKQGQRIYFCGIGRLIIGSLFLYTASACRISFIMYILGSIVLLSGGLIFILKKDKSIKILEFLQNKDDKFLRGMCMVVMGIGALILIAI